MPINKFGISLGRSGAEPYYQWGGLLRNYVRDNALCVVATDFDAKSRKIRRVALPVDDGDVANKRYVEQSMQILKDRQDEIERKMMVFQNNVQVILNELQKTVRQVIMSTHRDE
jgi:hypothetical protein